MVHLCNHRYGGAIPRPLFGIHGSPGPTIGNKETMGGSALFAIVKIMLLGLRSKEKQIKMLPTESQSIEVVICAFSAIAAIAAVVVAYLNGKKQMQISLFAEFTRRYQEIMLHIRKNGEDKEYYQTLYIDLCSEEFFMNIKKCLPKEVWSIWMDGMRHEIKDTYIGLWQRDKHNYNPDFQRFFDEIVSNNDKQIQSDNRYTLTDKIN